MVDPLSDNDDQIELKKRARRRLIGAVVFATVAAVVLPMVMDKDPPPALPNIELRIPAQDKGFVSPAGKPASAPTPVPTVAEPVPEPVARPEVAAAKPAPDTMVAKAIEKAPDKPAATAPKPAAAPAAAATTKPPATPSSKPPVAAAQVPKEADAKRAQAILAGQDAKPAADGPHVVLIGAYAQQSNVDNLKRKLGDLGIKVYTETLDAPGGKKTRVRAGPFPNRAAAEKAAARMKAIGVGGIVAAKS
jgi:DedD protein